MWQGSHLSSLEAGLWGELECLSWLTICHELCVFSRLNSSGTAVDEKNPQVEAINATKQEGAKINEGNVCFCLNFLSQLLIFIITGFEV